MAHRGGQVIVLDVDYADANGTEMERTYALVVDRSGAVRVRVLAGFWSSSVFFRPRGTGGDDRERWLALGVPVVRVWDQMRAKDARRRWPEAFAWPSSYCQPLLYCSTRSRMIASARAWSFT